VSARNYSDFSRSPTGFVRPTPELAGHTREVLGDYGVPEARIADLLATGAAFETP
jgi:crotonobetainyl-CoA:carnitine CoA-transferase CaiB-like acyl-CoA transferase